MQRNLFPDDSSGLNVVFAKYIRSQPFDFSLFEGFNQLRVLTYSASIPMIVRMLNLFNKVECVFGYEGVLRDVSTIIAYQKVASENLVTAIKESTDERRLAIINKINSNQARFFVVKDAIAHSKIYLLESDLHRRVIVGSANLSERAFSGKQAETVLVFDDDDGAWEAFEYDYLSVKETATSELTVPDLKAVETNLEHVPVLNDAQNSKDGLTVYVNTDTEVMNVPIVIRRVEKVSEQFSFATQSVAKPKRGQIQLNRKIVGEFLRLVRTRKREEQDNEPTWLTINRETERVLLSGQEISVDADWMEVQSDVALMIEYFENFQRGFYGDVPQHQKDYFMFMCWLYFSPFVCDLRNYAFVNQEYIFDFPMFAILYGKSNCGKTKLIETLMKSMFGYYKMVEKSQFTKTSLRALLQSWRRFPVAFDDVDKKQFSLHAPDIIKDETIFMEEFPAFVLSMNAEEHSFSTEIRKRCLILHTKASLPDNTETARQLYKSITSIQNQLTTSLYREYLKRVLKRFKEEPYPADMLTFSSTILTSIFADASVHNLPDWCVAVSSQDYRSKKYDKIRSELTVLYQTNPAIWDIRRTEVILTVLGPESFNLRKEIPDWLLKEGSKGGKIVLDRKSLEEFLDISLNRNWLRRLIQIR